MTKVMALRNISWLLNFSTFGAWWRQMLWLSNVSVVSPDAGIFVTFHYNDIIMGAMASQITSLTIVYSTVYWRPRSKKASKLRVTGLCEGNSPVTGEFPSQMASNVILCVKHDEAIIYSIWISLPNELLKALIDLRQCIKWSSRIVTSHSFVGQISQLNILASSALLHKTFIQMYTDGFIKLTYI